MTRRGHSICRDHGQINQLRGGNGDVERSVVRVAVSVSVKWMMNRNLCETAEIRSSAHQVKTCFLQFLESKFFGLAPFDVNL